MRAEPSRSSSGHARDLRTDRPADVNWFAVLAHHAARTPDKALTVFEGETTTYGEMAARGRTGRRPGRTRRRAAATSWRSSRTTAPSSSKRSSPPTTSAPSPCRSTGGWPRPRCATSSNTPGLGPWSATRPCSAWPTRRPRASGTRSCGSAWRRSTRRDGRASPTFAAARSGAAAGRRRPATTSTG